MKKEVQPVILSSEIFDENTYKIEKVPSTLLITPDLEEKISTNWNSFVEEAKKKGSTPWDSSYYRLENIHNTHSRILELSTIKYSQIRGLTHNTDLSLLEEKNRPNHIATASLIITQDDYFIFGERNKNTMSNSSIDFIGGGLQPDELEVETVKDIFLNQIKEMKEEIGVESSAVSKMVGLGITLSSKYNVIFIFLTKLNLRKDEVHSIFKSNNDDEMSDLLFVRESELKSFLQDKGSYRPLVADLYKLNKDKIN